MGPQVVRREIARWRGLLFAASPAIIIVLVVGCISEARGPFSSGAGAIATSSASGASSSPQEEAVSSVVLEPAPGQAPSSTPAATSSVEAPIPSSSSVAEGSATLDAETAGAANAMKPRTRTIALDPGHGGPESGASAEGLVEKDVNLKIALRLADLLRAKDFRVVLTRESDEATSPEYKGGGYRGGLVYDLQARVDIANAASADLFVSIHNNGSANPRESGTEVWYNAQRAFADRNLTLAKLVQEELLKRIRALGYPAVDRGIKDDSNFRVFQGRVFNIYVLGPGTGARPHTPTQMPGVLGESLFISNPEDAAMLRQERTLHAIAEGYRDAVLAYFDRYPQ